MTSAKYETELVVITRWTCLKSTTKSTTTSVSCNEIGLYFLSSWWVCPWRLHGRKRSVVTMILMKFLVKSIMQTMRPSASFLHQAENSRHPPRNRLLRREMHHECNCCGETGVPDLVSLVSVMFPNNSQSAFLLKPKDRRGRVRFAFITSSNSVALKNTNPLGKAVIFFNILNFSSPDFWIVPTRWSTSCKTPGE